MESIEFESPLIFELSRVLSQAADEVESEQRLDLAYEVLETVRFEQAHVSWLDRLRNTSSHIELRLSHRYLPVASGVVRHLAEPFLILENSRSEFLINHRFVSAATGLSELSQRNRTPNAIKWLDNVWFHEMSDRRLLTTWYLGGNQVFEGICTKIGFDYLDVSAGGKVLSIPKRALVASRTNKPSI